jgi:predicted tellurium resistance membrane protein TerC
MSQASQKRDLDAFFLHLVIYGGLLVFYFILVLRFLAPSLLQLFHQHRIEYALAAILLMLGQAVGLEFISHCLLRLIRRKRG